MGRLRFLTHRKAPPQTQRWQRSRGRAVEGELARGASFFPDGRNLLFYRRGPETASDLWLLSLEGKREPVPFLRTAFTEVLATVSPDGRFVAYTSDESGRWEVYIVPYPGPGRKWRVSTDGGEEPIWARSGRELFYRFGGKWMVVPVTLGAGLSVGQPRVLFEGPYINVPGFSYDVAPDAQRLLVIKGTQQQVRQTRIEVVLNWFEEIKPRLSSAEQ
ncbi:MAG: hypothetical protein ACRD3M_01075 [Thermoanaerobaculia bacterium]